MYDEANIYAEYDTAINEEDLNYQQAERTSDIQLPSAVNTLLLAVWLVICMVGFFVMLVEKSPVAGTVIIAIPTFLGMVIKPTFALCMMMLVLPTGAGIGLKGAFTLNRGIGIALAVSFALNLLISRPKLTIRHKGLWILVLFTAWIILSSLKAHYLRGQLTLAFTHIQLLAFVLIVYWILETNNPKTLVWVLRAYVVGSLGTVIITYMTGAAMLDVAGRERYQATLGRMIDANMLAALIAMGFLACLYLFARDKNILWRLVYIVGLIFLPIMILRTGSRGGLIALAFTLMSPLLFVRQIARKPALALLLLLTIIFASGSMSFLVKRGGLAESVVERVGRVEIIRKSLNYRILLCKKAVEVGLSKPFLGTSGSAGWLEESGAEHFPHADFFRALGYYGIPAAMLFTIFVIMAMLTVKRMPLGIEKLYARAALTFLLVMGLGIGQLEQKHFWVFLTVVMAMERISHFYGDAYQKQDGHCETLEDYTCEYLYENQPVYSIETETY